MEFWLLTIFTYLSLALIAIDASLSPEAYWNLTLPTTPMPKAVKVLLSPGLPTDLDPRGGEKDDDNILAIKNILNMGKGGNPTNGDGAADALVFYFYGATQDQVRAYSSTDLFFFENDIKIGKNMTLRFAGSTTNSVAFLPREDAEKLPFSSTKFPIILKHFSVESNSSQAETMKKAIEDCEKPTVQWEDKYCATSLEEMIDYCTSKMGKNLYALSTDVERETQLQEYGIEEVRNISGEAAVACHMLNYVYAVFYCHGTGSSRFYTVSLVGDDGTRVKAVAVCHADTSTWNPKHLSFQLLKVGPGSDPICHFLPEDNVIWVSK